MINKPAMINKPVIAVAAVVMAAAAATAYYFHSRAPNLPSLPTGAQPTSASVPAQPDIEHPIPAATGGASQTQLPALAASDPVLKAALGTAAGDSFASYLVPDNLIRHIVVTVDNLPRDKVPLAKRPTVPVAGSFIAEGDELHATLDPKNFERYDALVNAVRQLDVQRLAQVYLHFYPLFQSVYQDLGYPNGYFNDRLVEVIDSLLATPEPLGPIELTRPNVMYVFADPTLEARPAGQKLLLRMGPAHAAVIKAKLTELRAIITAAPLKR